jgi:hypothetical protein
MAALPPDTMYVCRTGDSRSDIYYLAFLIDSSGSDGHFLGCSSKAKYFLRTVDRARPPVVISRYLAGCVRAHDPHRHKRLLHIDTSSVHLNAGLSTPRYFLWTIGWACAPVHGARSVRGQILRADSGRGATACPLSADILRGVSVHTTRAVTNAYSYCILMHLPATPTPVCPHPDISCGQ